MPGGYVAGNITDYPMQQRSSYHHKKRVDNISSEH